ncbi:hypothetical protein [Phytohabitans kaempferiae]|uniref:MoeA N-terminal and linker domain-containing protein n=1 Tax=Phytohabitans kaempferiae TaxID=1620943 RepID=A0ABV6LV25_9ACTN
MTHATAIRIEDHTTRAMPWRQARAVAATGAVVPAAAEAVVPYERCQVGGGSVSGRREAKDHIRRAGEDARPGDELLLP